MRFRTHVLNAGLLLLLAQAIAVPAALAGIATNAVRGPAQYEGHVLEYRDFSDRDLSGASFAYGDLVNVDFAGALLGGARFSDTVLVRVDFSGAHLGRADFSGATLENVDFSDAVLFGACFCNADLRGTDFSSARLEGAVFSVSDRELLEAEGVNLTEVRLVPAGRCAQGVNAAS